MIGTRPEAIKMAPVAHALVARGHRPSLFLTGQHPQLDPAEFGLREYPSLRLDCPGHRDPHRHVREVTETLLPSLSGGLDLLVVQGDTSSALGAALAGFLARVPVAHVEAGLRTHDARQPWPEEEYRTAIDAQADILFAPTEVAAANLRAEQVRGEIHVTGNTSIDAALAAEAELPPVRPKRGRAPRLLVTCHRRESWSEGLESIARALTEIVRHGAAIDFVLHPNAHVASKMRTQLDGTPGISLFGPMSHGELIRRIRDCTLVLSDSGGIQEEAPALGTPLLVMREKTERPEAIASGNSRLVGTSTKRIVAETLSLLGNPADLAAMSRRAFPFGDGRAAERIAYIIHDWLKRRANVDQSLGRGTVYS